MYEHVVVEHVPQAQHSTAQSARTKAAKQVRAGQSATAQASRHGCARACVSWSIYTARWPALVSTRYNPYHPTARVRFTFCLVLVSLFFLCICCVFVSAGDSCVEILAQTQVSGRVGLSSGEEPQDFRASIRCCPRGWS